MIEHVYERASMASALNAGVIVATDDERIAGEVRRFGGRARMTRPDHPSGTDRLAEVASAEVAEIYVNIQGDEPLIDPDAINAAVWATHGDEHASLGTLKCRLRDTAEIADPNVVKVVTNHAGDAIYFSRHPIPFVRGGGERPAFYKHVGLYVFRRALLLAYPDLPVGPLERAECLEQLRALENGYRIKVVETEYESMGVDTPGDLERVNRLFEMARHRFHADLQNTT